MTEKAIGNHWKSAEIRLILMVLLAVAAGMALGFWLGGWRESLILRSELQQIPDINQCY